MSTRSPYPTDVSDEEWAFVAPYLTLLPEDASQRRYPGVNHELLRECRILVLAMITTWRWDQGDQFPNGRQLGAEWLSQLRAALDRKGRDSPG